MNNFEFILSFNHLIPEILIVFGALLLLLIGVGLPPRKQVFVFYLGIFILILSICLRYLLGFSLAGQLPVYIYNNSYSISTFSLFANTLILIAGIAIFIFAVSLYEDENYLKYEGAILMMISLAGMMFMIKSENLLTLYMSLEMMSLPLYILVAINRGDSNSSEAGIKYFTLGAVASCMYLFGAVLIYCTSIYAFDALENANSSTLDFVVMRDYLAFITQKTNDTINNSPHFGLLIIGFILITVAFLFKCSAVPFHMWTPDVYHGAPTIITAFLSSAPKLASTLLLIKLYEQVLQLMPNTLVFDRILVFASLASILVGSIGAIVQDNIKRLLAYSAIGHIGFGFICTPINFDEGHVATIIYLIIYLSMIVTTFGCILMLKRNGKDIEKVTDLSMLAKKQPLIAFALATMMFSMAGIPPLAGFFAKYFVLSSILDIKGNYYSILVFYVLFSVVAAYYYLRVVKVMYFDESKDDIEVIRNKGISLVIIMGLIFNLFFVFFGDRVTKLVYDSSAELYQEVLNVD